MRFICSVGDYGSRNTNLEQDRVMGHVGISGLCSHQRPVSPPCVLQGADVEGADVPHKALSWGLRLGVKSGTCAWFK